jgi:hypothetical protein
LIASTLLTELDGSSSGSEGRLVRRYRRRKAPGGVVALGFGAAGMVRGCAMAVTAVALVYQWAEITNTARGRSTQVPKARHAAV